MTSPLRLVTVAVVLLAATSGTALAQPAASVPTPPPPPGCGACNNPPFPPTPVPTVAPTQVVVQQVVSVRLATSRVRRGHTGRLSVDASTGDKVLVTIHYRRGKPQVIRGAVGDSGSFTARWTVPGRAPLGRASAAVTVTGSTDHLTKSIAFTVAA